MLETEHKLSINIEYFKAVNYAAVHNNVPVCQSAEVTNLTDNDIVNLIIHVEGPFLNTTHTATHETIKGKSTMRLNDLNIDVNANELLSMSEMVSTNFDIYATSDGEEIFRKTYDIDLMAFNQWLGTSYMPHMLSSFMQPNHPLLSNILIKAGEIMKEKTGNAIFDGYASNNPNVVMMQIACIYQALRKEGIIYVVAPPSYEIVGQRIRLAEQVISEKTGNCIELTLLMASLLESIGLNTIIILEKDHAYLGAWLVQDNYSQCVGDDISFLTKKSSDGINEIIFMESTMIAAEEGNFKEAVETGAQNLLKATLYPLDEKGQPTKPEREFDLFVDVKRCRLDGIRPLPTRIFQDGQWDVVSGVEHDVDGIVLPSKSRYDLSKLNDNKQLTKVDIWERKLLDFTLKNAMLSLHLNSKAIQIHTHNIDLLEDSLNDGKEYSIMPAPNSKIFNKDVIYSSEGNEDLADYLISEMENGKLHSFIPEAENNNILKNIYRHARTATEETGANPLFMAVGALRWKETEQSIDPHYAPVILLPVELIRRKGNYYIRMRDEETMLNVTLIEFLKQNYDIDIKGLRPLPTDGHGTDVKMVFAIIRDAIKNMRDWDIVEECILGTFSFNKYLMWNDIHSNVDKLHENKVIKSLMESRLSWTPKTLVDDLKERDKSVKPQDICTPLPLDSSQMAAIVEASDNSTFILYGPPGTGKSQTITNLITNALYHGQRVLFVAEKMAALSVVEKRLSQLGLEPFCLELHSNKVAKKHVLEQLKMALDTVRIQNPKQHAETAENLYAARLELIKHMEDLHTTTDADGFTIYDCISHYEAIDADPIDVNLSLANELTAETLDNYKYELLSPIETILQLVGQPSEHPLKGLMLNEDSMMHADELKEILDKACEQSKRLSEMLAITRTIAGENIKDTRFSLSSGLQLCSALNNMPNINGKIIRAAVDADTLSEIKHVANVMARRKTLYDQITASYKSEILKESAVTLGMEWKTIKESFVLVRYFKTKNFINKMSFFKADIRPDDIDTLLETLLDYHRVDDEYQELRTLVETLCDGTASLETLRQILNNMPELKASIQNLANINELGVREISDHMESVNWRQTKTAIAQASAFRDEWNANMVKLSLLADDEESLCDDYTNHAKSSLEKWSKNCDMLRDWYQWCEHKRRLVKMGMADAVKALESKPYTAQRLHDAFFKGYFRNLCNKKIARSNALSTFEGMMFDEKVKKYKRLTGEFQALCQKELYARLASNIPQLTDNLDNSSEMGILNRNISNGGRGLSLRNLLDQIPELLPKLCPCMLMSPMSVAQYLTFDHKKFDIVIFDEASQMPTSEAIGSIARGKSLIVVGDPKQMPPTSFFMATNTNDDEAEIDDMESILEDCRALGIPSLQLSWHYRSRHESLIAFSNNEYYDGQLITFPSTDDKETKVIFKPINGCYDKGGRRCNISEANAIVAEIERRLVNPAEHKKSIGVIAFSAAQQNLIEDLLTDHLERNKRLQDLANSMYEPIFVKNLENVQGDERDVILFSIGYGPDKNGHVSMNFGPLNNQGGERRLNVAVSRARREMIVFSTLKSSQIDLRRSQAKGVEGLKHFLEYAERQTLTLCPSTAKSETSSIAQSIAKRLKERGHNVAMSVGKSKFKIDIAIVDKNDSNKYAIGILLDGETYRDTETTRDREIVQPSVLESLSWKVMRVWANDWFNNSDRVIRRIEEQLERNEEENEEDEEEMTAVFQVSEDEIIADESNATSYIEYSPNDDIPTMDIFIRNLVETEQPVTLQYISRKTAAQYGKRLTLAFKRYVNETLPSAGVYVDNTYDDITVWSTAEDAAGYTSYRANSGRDISEIPTIEVVNFMKDLINQSISVSIDNLPILLAKRLGSGRRSIGTDAACNKALEIIKQNESFTIENGRIHV